MTYVDGFVIPLKKDKVNAYRRMATYGKKAWMKHGAVDYYECVSDDLRVKKGMGQGFKKMVKLKNNEACIFSFIVFKSRAHRDEVNKKVMAEMKKHMTQKDMEKMGEMMDMKRFSYGGFKTIVQA